MSDGFEGFMQEATSRLLRLARRLTNSREDAEDLTQEALLKLHSGWKQVSVAADPTAYANRVLVNCHLDRQKKRRVDIVGIFDTDLPSAEWTAFSDDRLTMREALARLPTRQRTLMVLRYYEQLSTKEIGDVMGIEESSVRSGIARALASLETSMSDHPPA